MLESALMHAPYLHLELKERARSVSALWNNCREDGFQTRLKGYIHDVGAAQNSAGLLGKLSYHAAIMLLTKGFPPFPGVGILPGRAQERIQKELGLGKFAFLEHGTLASLTEAFSIATAGATIAQGSKEIMYDSLDSLLQYAQTSSSGASSQLLIEWGYSLQESIEAASVDQVAHFVAGVFTARTVGRYIASKYFFKRPIAPWTLSGTAIAMTHGLYRLIKNAKSDKANNPTQNNSTQEK